MDLLKTSKERVSALDEEFEDDWVITLSLLLIVATLRYPLKLVDANKTT